MKWLFTWINQYMCKHDKYLSRLDKDMFRDIEYGTNFQIVCRECNKIIDIIYD